jgi:hypothetical protein
MIDGLIVIIRSTYPFCRLNIYRIESPKTYQKLKNQSFQGITPSLFIFSSLSRSQSIKILEFSLVK